MSGGPGAKARPGPQPPQISLGPRDPHIQFKIAYLLLLGAHQRGTQPVFDPQHPLWTLPAC